MDVQVRVVHGMDRAELSLSKHGPVLEKRPSLWPNRGPTKWLQLLSRHIHISIILAIHH